MEVLGIRTPTVMSRELNLSGARNDRLIDLLNKVGATAYLSGPSASAYLDVELFRQRGIRVEYKSYDYQPYSQLCSEFRGESSILDLLFNTGPEARGFLKSGTPDRLAA